MLDLCQVSGTLNGTTTGVILGRWRLCGKCRVPRRALLRHVIHGLGSAPLVHLEFSPSTHFGKNIIVGFKTRTLM